MFTGNRGITWIVMISHVLPWDLHKIFAVRGFGCQDLGAYNPVGECVGGPVWIEGQLEDHLPLLTNLDGL